MILKLFWLIARKSERFVYLVILKKFIGLSVVENPRLPLDEEIKMRAFYGDRFRNPPRFEIMTLKKVVCMKSIEIGFIAQAESKKKDKEKLEEILNFPKVDFVAMKRELKKKEGGGEPIIKKQKIEKREECKSYKEREDEAYGRVPD